MTKTAWRIATEASSYSASDLSGAGAKLTGGRWNHIGTPLVYCSENISLATLETLSYARTGALPFNRYLVRIEIPSTVWSRRANVWRMGCCPVGLGQPQRRRSLAKKAFSGAVDSAVRDRAGRAEFFD